jgi:hypothetical protein
MTTTHTFGEVTITVEQPDGMPPVSLTPGINTATEEEFHLAVEQLGGLAAARRANPTSACVWFYTEDGQGLMLFAPRPADVPANPVMAAFATEQQSLAVTA